MTFINFSIEESVIFSYFSSLLVLSDFVYSE